MQKNKRQQQDLIAELRRRQAKDHRPVYEGKDGTIEDIITGGFLLQVKFCTFLFPTAISDIPWSSFLILPKSTLLEMRPIELPVFDHICVSLCLPNPH